MKLIKLLIPVLNRMPKGFIRFSGRLITGGLLRKYASIKVHGEDILRSRIGKPTIYISNHLSNIDGIILDRLLEHNNIAFMAGVKLGQNPFTAFFLNTLNYIPITPGSADKNAIKLALRHLQGNGSILIFPEGTRSRTGSLIEAKRGFTLMVKMAKVSVVPIALEGTEKLLPINTSDMSGERLQRSDISITIGTPFSLPGKHEIPEDADWDAHCAAFAMYRISEMLQPKYQGVYKTKSR